jgi:hypothetical protein
VNKVVLIGLPFEYLSEVENLQLPLDKPGKVKVEGTAVGFLMKYLKG